MSGRPPRGSGEQPRATPAAPRFDLRFAGRRGMLRLARPLDAGRVRVEQLELALGPMPGPLDLTEVVSRFRHRHARVRKACITVGLGALAEIARGQGARIAIEAVRDDGVVVSVRDGWGAVAATVRAWADGADVLLVLRDVRAVEDGPTGTWRRLTAAASRLGVRFDPEAGVLRMPRPVHGVLREALVPRGWRVPDERSEPQASPRIDDGAITLELGPAADEDDAASRLTDLDSARRLAPIVAALAEDDVDGAAQALDTVREDAPHADGLEAMALVTALEREGGEHDVRRATGGDGPVALAATVRLALRAGEAVAGADAAVRLAAVEPSDVLAAHALSASAEQLAEADPARSQRLLGEALARDPGATELALRWLALAADTGDPEGTEGIVRRALATPAPETVRARVAIAGARVLLGAGDPDGAHALFERARRLVPGDSDVLEGLAGAKEARGELEQAVSLLDRVVSTRAERGERSAAARAERRAAAILSDLGRHDGAEQRLLRALDRGTDVADTALALARVRRCTGARGDAAEAYARLLHVEDPVPSEALEEAARFHLDETGDLPGARAFATRLGRHGDAADRASALLDEIGRREEPGT